jgi:hypothetical protein
MVTQEVFLIAVFIKQNFISNMLHTRCRKDFYEDEDGRTVSTVRGGNRSMRQEEDGLSRKANEMLF